MEIMSTQRNNSPLDPYLQGIPSQFRNRITKEYHNIKIRFKKGEFDSAGLSCGKFCEECLRFLQDQLTSQSIGFKEEIKNFQSELIKLEKLPGSAGNDSIRVIITRALSFLYTLRNKRNIGHSGGDVEANVIDASTINKISDWIMCELIRIYHNIPIEDAQQIIDFISLREIPDVWEINGRKRVLKEGLSTKQKVLLLLYSEENQAIFFEDLANWIEYKNKSDFKTKVISPLHKASLLDYNQILTIVTISPKGCKEVEEKILI
jgi:hypothetical protein